MPHNVLLLGDHAMKRWIGRTKRFLGLSILLIFIFCFCIQGSIALPALPFDLGALQQKNPQDLPDPFQPGVVIVKTTNSASEQVASALSSAHAAIGARVAKDFSAEGAPGLFLIALPEGMTAQDAVRYYSNISAVAFAEPDYYRFSTVLPNDPDLWRQWGMFNAGQIYKEGTAPGTAGADIQAAVGWNTTTNSNVTIAVLDTGVDYLHEDLAGNIWTNPQTRTHGYDAITGGLDPMDLASHGTHCAGIIGAIGNNGRGGSGVIWNGTVLPVRFLNSFGTGTVSDEIEAILWAARNGAKIFSCSFGAGTPSQAEYDVIAGTDGLFICAAGNNGQDNDVVPLYPSSYDLENIISVAATDARDNLAAFSNYGKRSVDIGAPGVLIYSTMHNQYAPIPIWRDPFDSFSNWTTHGNWTLDSQYYISPPTCALGTVNNTATNQTEPPVILSLKEPLHISNLTNPIISYQLQLVGVQYTFSVQASADNLTWKTLEYDTKLFTILPWIYRECKIPHDLTGDRLYIRFVADGSFVSCFLDDVTLSDGYGELAHTRYNYMNGTSMATPFVTGIIGLLKAYAPDASYLTIKEALIRTADPVPSLSNCTVSGGRANLSAALAYLTNKPSTDHIPLSPGWNHISVAKRLIPGNDTAYELFGQVTNTSGHSVLKYTNASWITVPADEKITPLSSYWIWTEKSQNITPKTEPTQNGTYTKDLRLGWNGIGVVGTKNESAKTHLTPIGDNWTYVIGFDPMAQRYEEPIIRNGTGNHSDSRILLPWQGYWLYANQNVTYQVTIPF